MTDPQNPPAELSDVELIREVGTKVMKWKIVACEAQGGWLWWRAENGDWKHRAVGEGAWNPLTDWNHWREVEEKIMKNPKWCNDYCNELPRMAGEFDTSMFLWSDLRTRCLAALQAVRSQLKP